MGINLPGVFISNPLSPVIYFEPPPGIQIELDENYAEPPICKIKLLCEIGMEKLLELYTFVLNDASNAVDIILGDLSILIHEQRYIIGCNILWALQNAIGLRTTEMNIIHNMINQMFMRLIAAEECPGCFGEASYDRNAITEADFGLNDIVKYF